VTIARVALITGCGKPDGMGRAIARTLAASGVAVVVTDKVPTGVLNRRQEILLARGAGPLHPPAPPAPPVPPTPRRSPTAGAASSR
jgi:NAD(P)-dependent dehydrogenase (short-subunit alcohol dehydrogenase family)